MNLRKQECYYNHNKGVQCTHDQNKSDYDQSKRNFNSCLHYQIKMKLILVLIRTVRVVHATDKNISIESELALFWEEKNSCNILTAHNTTMTPQYESDHNPTKFGKNKSHPLSRFPI